jgi:hypothetical protein
MKKSGVRGGPERFFFELIKSRVQIDLPGVPNASSNCNLQTTTDRPIHLQKEHFSYQTANFTTNIESWNKCIAFSRFDGFFREVVISKIRISRAKHGKSFTPKVKFFRARPTALDAKLHPVGRS